MNTSTEPRRAPGEARRDILAKLAEPMTREELLEVALAMADELDNFENSAGHLIASMHRVGSTIIDDRIAMFGTLSNVAKILAMAVRMSSKRMAKTLRELVPTIEDGVNAGERATAWPPEFEAVLALPWIARHVNKGDQG